MGKRKNIQITLAVLAGAALVTAGAWAGLRYWSGSDFSPSGRERSLKNNQVLFQQEQDLQATGGRDGDDASRWEKQEDAQRQEGPQTDSGNFLFQTDGSQQASSTGGILGDNTQKDGNTAQTPDHIFDPSGGTESGGGTSGGGTGGGGEETGPTEPTLPTEPIVIPPDPEPVKRDPPKDALDSDKTFDEKNFSRCDDWDIWRYYYIRQDDSSESILYAGQTYADWKSLEKALFASMITCFYDKDGYRRPLTEAEYGIYIRIDGVSFDGGATMVSKYPVTIPSGADMQVRVSYRFSTKSPWEPLETEDPFWVAYKPAQSRVILLSRNPASGSTAIDPDAIVNKDNQYPAAGTALNLLEYQLDMLVENPDDLFWVFGTKLTSLYTGWTEDGKPVSWLYPVTAGRHVLLPGSYVPLKTGYDAAIQIYPVNADFEQDPANGDSYYFQTVVGALVDADGVLRVPEYAQAIFLDGTKGVRVLSLPSTLLLIPDQSGDGLEVTDAYEVAPGNPVFSSKDGLLLNAAGTVIRGVPTSVTSLTVPKGIQAVRPLKSNRIQELHLQAGDPLPQLRYENMPGITVYVADEQVAELCQRDAEEIEAYNIHIRSEKDSYTLKTPFLMDSQGGIKKLLNDDCQILNLPDQKKLILRSDAFSGCQVAATLTISKDTAEIVLEKNCFRDSAVHLILCATEEQVNRVRQKLARIGVTDISVAKLKTTADGFVCAELQDGQYRLVSAPKDLVSFSEIKGVSVTEIGNAAFEGCASLRWVTLPECVKLVERRAFADCASLEGVVIQNRQEITLQENAFTGCYALRFLGSNAVKGSVADSLGDGLGYAGFYPDGGTGYPVTTDFSTNPWASSPGASCYAFYDCGDARMLYAMDEAGKPTRLLRSGAVVSGAVKLPADTIEIALKAFQNVATEFTINWEDLTQLRIIGSNAFNASALTGDVALRTGATVFVGNSAFADCYGLRSFYADSVNVEFYAFTNCYSLESVELRLDPYGIYSAQLPAGLFFGCYSLAEVKLNNEVPPQLGWFSPKVWFCLRDNPDEADFLYVPEGCEEKYVDAWTYTYAGYKDRDDLWGELFFDILDPDLTGTAVEQWSWDVRRTIRSVIAGLDPADEPNPAEGFSWYVDDAGTVTLLGVPEDRTELNLLGENIGLGVTGYVDYLGSGVFQNCPNLNTVTIPYRLIGFGSEQRLTGIETDAFRTGSALLTVIFEDATPPTLVPAADGSFAFRDDGGQVLVQVPEGCKETYLNAWLENLGGAYTEDELLAMMGWAGDIQEQIGAEGFGLECRDREWVLTAVPADAETLTLDAETLGLPEGEHLSRIASGAFTGAAGLGTVTIPDGLTVIESGAFPTGGEHLNLIFAGQTPPSLLAGTDGRFSFGLEGDKLSLTVPKDAEEDYLHQWKANLAGFENYEAALAATQAAHQSWNDVRVRQTTDSALLEQENQLRAMQGLPQAEDPLTHFAYASIRGGKGIRLNRAPTYVERITLDAETMGLEKGEKLLEINADSFQDCDLLTELVLPDTVDAITSKVFTCGAEHLTLDFTAWTKDKTPPTLVLLNQEPFSFGLTKENAKVTVRVTDEQTKQRFVERWAPAFAGAESRQTLIDQLYARAAAQTGQTTLTQEEQAALAAQAALDADARIAQAERLLNEIITYPKPERQASGTGENPEG